MGMYSEVINSCKELGPKLIGRVQTKDLQNLMDTYWLSPRGELYLINNDSTWTIAEELAADGADRIFGLNVTPTGKRGSVQPYKIYGKIRFTNGIHEAVAWFEGGIMKQVLCRGPALSCERVDMDGSML